MIPYITGLYESIRIYHLTRKKGKYIKKVNSDYIKNRLAQHGIDRKVQGGPFDREYKIYDIQEVLDFVRKLRLDRKQGKGEAYDCEDFTFELLYHLKKKYPQIAAGFIAGESSIFKGGHVITFIQFDFPIFYVDNGEISVKRPLFKIYYSKY